MSPKTVKMAVRSAVALLALSASLLTGIGQFEGFRETAHIPVKGDVPTIGFGTTKDVQMGDKITPIRAMIKLMDDIDLHSSALKKCIHVPLYQNEWDAFLSLAYNVGAGAVCQKANKARKDHRGRPWPEPDRLIDVLNQGNYEEACSRISHFNKAGGRVLAGLTKRRKIERELCEGKRKDLIQR